MAGMYPICIFPKFSTRDPEKFGNRLKKWCQETAYMHGRCMLVFDSNELLAEGETVLVIQDGYEVYQKTLNEISFTYLHFAGQLCIMYKIWENKTQSVIYNMPMKWNGTEIWVGDNNNFF